VREEEYRRREGGEGACTAPPPPGVKARPPEGGDARAWTAKEPELFKPPTTAPSPSRTPCFLFTVLFACLGPNHAEPGSASSALRPLRCHAPSPPHHHMQEHEVSTETPSTLLWTRPSSRGWTEPCELAVCLLPAACSRHHATSLESRPSSRAGRLQVPLPSSPRALLCHTVVSFLCSMCVAELRFAVGTHRLSTPPSSQGLAFLWPGVV
jgi:hypothetical protein